MHSRDARTPWRIGLTVALLAAAALTATAASWNSGPRYFKNGYVHVVEADGYVYSFDAAWRVETLRRAPGVDGSLVAVTVEDPVREESLRRTLLANLGVVRLEQVPAEGQREMASLRALGYL